jgi:hypothetical protein
MQLAATGFNFVELTKYVVRLRVCRWSGVLFSVFRTWGEQVQSGAGPIFAQQLFMTGKPAILLLGQYYSYYTQGCLLL